MLGSSSLVALAGSGLSITVRSALNPTHLPLEQLKKLDPENSVLLLSLRKSSLLD